MEFHFTVKTQLALSWEPGDKTSKHVATKYNLEPSRNLSKEEYVKGEELTKDGVKVVTDTLCSALMSNVHYAHEHELIDSAEHLRSIIQKLEEMFVMIPDIKTGHMK